VVDLTGPSGRMDEDLVRCLCHVSFAAALSKLICSTNFDPCSWQALNLSEGEGLAEKDQWKLHRPVGLWSLNHWKLHKLEGL
jgi:hypothetical protein